MALGAKDPQGREPRPQDLACPAALACPRSARRPRPASATATAGHPHRHRYVSRYRSTASTRRL